MPIVKSFHAGSKEVKEVEPPSRGLSQPSSTSGNPPEVPLGVERELPTKVTPNPNIQPHSDDSGDAYYLGDIYEPEIARSLWEIKNPKPYLSYLKSLAVGWPHITWLADFMEVGTSPVKWKFLTDEDTQNRAERTRVAIIDFYPDKDSARTDIQTSEKLTNLLSNSAFNHDPAYARVIIVEDLSRDVIETLGSQYDIDPLFFRGQISDYLWYKERDPWVELNDLEHICTERNFFNIRYMRPRYFKNEDSINKAKDDLGAFNVLRRLEQDLSYRVRQLRNPTGPSVGVVRSKASLWIRNNKGNEKGALGILVVDPTLSEGFPLWGGPRNLNPPPSMHASIPPSPPRTSLFEDIIHYAQHMSKDDILRIKDEPSALGIPILSLVAAEWLTVVNYITTGLIKIEWELEHTEYRKDDPGGLDGALDRLHPLRRLMPVYRAFINEVLTTILHPSNIHSSSSSTIPCHLGKLRGDFTSILNRIDLLQIRTQTIISLATTIMSIEENKRAMKMNSNLVRVTYLAVVFVPVQFVSSFFSMTPDLGSLGHTFWIYFVIAVPLTFLCFTVADPRRVSRLFQHVSRKLRGLVRVRVKDN